MNILNQFFDKNYERQKAHRSLENGDMLSILNLQRIEDEVWASSSSSSKEAYMKTAQFLTQNIPLTYKDATYDYFRLCVIFANINWQITKTKKLPEEKEYSSYFEINNYGNFLPAFRPTLSKKRDEFVYSGTSSSIIRNLIVSFDRDDQFVQTNWNIYKDTGSFMNVIPGFLHDETSPNNFGFVYLKHLVIPIPPDQYASPQLLQKAVDIVFHQGNFKLGKTRDKTFSVPELEPFRTIAHKKEFHYKSLFIILAFIGLCFWFILFLSKTSANLDVPYDLDCSDVKEEVWVGDYDPNGLDRDGDGWGCESYGG